MMEFKYSTLRSELEYENHGLCEGIPLRVHKDVHIENAAIVRSQKDWNKLVGPITGYKGGFCKEFSFVSGCIPEGLPERLDIISYANEFAFIYDDAMENVTQQDNESANSRESKGFLDVFGTNALDPTALSNMRPEKMLQAKIFMAMMAIDKKRAITTMKSWAKFVQKSSVVRTEPFETLEQYIPHRITDCGELYWSGLTTFTMALTIPEDEVELCTRLGKPAYAAMGLTNDLYSWPKERAEASRAGLDYVFNAVWVIMRERDVSEKEAVEICSEVIKKYVKEYVAIVEKTSRNTALSKDTRTFIEALQYSISGNAIWSIYSPRYA